MEGEKVEAYANEGPMRVWDLDRKAWVGSRRAVRGTTFEDMVIDYPQSDGFGAKCQATCAEYRSYCAYLPPFLHLC